MDAIALLLRQQDHLFEHVGALRSADADADTDSDRRARKVRAFIAEASLHLGLEEELAVGLARRRTNLWVTRNDDAAVRLTAALASLAEAVAPGHECGAASADDFEARVDAAAEALTRQVAFENEELVPLLFDCYSDAELMVLGRSMESCFAAQMQSDAA